MVYIGGPIQKNVLFVVRNFILLLCMVGLLGGTVNKLLSAPIIVCGNGRKLINFIISLDKKGEFDNYDYFVSFTSRV